MAGTDIPGGRPRRLRVHRPGARARRARRRRQPRPDVQVRIPLGMLNRHGLVAGATGTGKTKTLQLMAEQLSAAGRAGVPRRHQGRPVRHRRAGRGRATRSPRGPRTSGRTGRPRRYPVEFLALGGLGTGVPVRATMTAFGPTLLAKVLGLNDDAGVAASGWSSTTPTRPGSPLLDLKDLRAVIQYLTSRRGQGRPRGARRPVEGDGRGDPARADRVRGPGRRGVLRRARVRHHATCCARPPDGRGMVTCPRAARPCRTGRRCSRRS